MLNIRIASSILTDGSMTYAVLFEATHGDVSTTTVTIECDSEVGAGRIHEALTRDGSFAYTDATR